MESEARAAAVRTARLDIDPAFRAAQEAQQRQEEANRSRAMNLRRYTSAAFAGASLGMAFSGAARGLGQIEAGDSYAAALQKVTQQFVEGVPVIGTFLRGFREFVQAATGEAQRLAGAKQTAAFAERLASLSTARAGIAGAAYGQVAEIARGGVDLRAGAGLSDDPAGRLELARRIAQARTVETAQIRQFRAGAGTGAALRGAEGAVAGAVSTGTTEDERMARARYGQLLATQQREAREALDHERRQHEAINETIRARAALIDAEIDKGRQRLDQLKQQEERNRGAAGQFAMMDPLQQEFLLQSAGQLQRGGFRSLMPEQAGALSGFGPTADILHRQAEAAGEADPRFRQLLAATGGASPEQLRREIGALEGRIKVEVDWNQEQLRATLTEELERHFRVARVEIDRAAAAQAAEAGNQLNQAAEQRRAAEGGSGGGASGFFSGVGSGILGPAAGVFGS